MRALAGVLAWVTTQLAAATSVVTDDLWIVDSTPVECGRSRETVNRSDLAGWAEYGYCASHTRYFWGLRLHLVATVHGLPIGWALAGAKADEREVFEDILGQLPPDLAARVAAGRQTTLGDKNYFGRQFETRLDEAGIDHIRPTRYREQPRTGQEFLKPFRQVIESIFDTHKDQLDLEHHAGRTPDGVLARIATRILALTAVIWHNDRIGAPVLRSLTAYDH